MLSELLIENYRGIKNLDLGKLGKINIIAGANNTGKTSILEVIRSLESPNDIRQWRKIGHRDNQSNVVVPGLKMSMYEVIDALFSYDLDGEADAIKYRGAFENRSFAIEIERVITDVFVSEKELAEFKIYSSADVVKDPGMDVEYDTQDGFSV